VTLSKLNDPDNALRAYTYSVKLDPTDPIGLLNYAIFQTNTGVSKSQIDTTMQQFHQYYAERATSTNQRELDTSMLDVAVNLGYPPPPPPPKPVVPLFPPPVPLISPAEPGEDDVPTSSKSHDEDTSKQPPQEIPVVKTKIYDDSRHKQRRTKQ